MSDEKWHPNTNFIACAIFTFASVISFFQVNSYWADQHHFNGMWKVLGAIAAVGAVFFLVKTVKSSTGKGG